MAKCSGKCRPGTRHCGGRAGNDGRGLTLQAELAVMSLYGKPTEVLCQPPKAKAAAFFCFYHNWDGLSMQNRDGRNLPHKLMGCTHKISVGCSHPGNRVEQLLPKTPQPSIYMSHNNHSTSTTQIRCASQFGLLAAEVAHFPVI